MVPQYLVDLTGPAAAARRPFADVCAKHVLPADGMSLTLPSYYDRYSGRCPDYAACGHRYRRNVNGRHGRYDSSLRPPATRMCRARR